MLMNPKDRLSGCHVDIQKLVLALAEEMDLLVVCGHRGEAEQNAAFKRKASKLKYPNSAHNKTPSRAVDLAPLKGRKLDWNDIAAFKRMQKRIREIAACNGIKLKPLISWDLVHVELA